MVNLLFNLNAGGQGLDIVETAAVFAALSATKFKNDPSLAKQGLLSALRATLQQMMSQQEKGALDRRVKTRHPAYLNQTPGFVGRDTELHSLFVVTGSDAFAPRHSFENLRAAASTAGNTKK